MHEKLLTIVCDSFEICLCFLELFEICFRIVSDFFSFQSAPADFEWKTSHENVLTVVMCL